MIKFNIIQYFKQYITKNNLKSNRLTSGDNFLSRLLGKEIGLLFLGIEDTVDEDEIIKALKNWNGLDVTEKWYLYTMANANLSKDHNKGWRGAIKKILIEN